MPGYGAPAATTSTPRPTAGQALMPSCSRVRHTVLPLAAAYSDTLPSNVGTTTTSFATVAHPNGGEPRRRRQTVFPVPASSAYTTPLPSAGLRANALGEVTALSREQSS